MVMQNCRVLFKQLPEVHKAMAARMFSGQLAGYIPHGNPSALLTSIIADLERRTLPAHYLHSQEIAMGHMNPYAFSLFPTGAIRLTSLHSSHHVHYAAFASRLRYT